MNPEELFRGESETIEYKASVAPKSEAYMKTVIAFANGRGGQLLFGVQDISGEALGLGRKTVFKYMDAVANAIATKCEPRIHPHIYLYEVDRKPIIIVDVPAGMETPYWIQGEGIENGTYVRVGATTRKADRYRIEELILRGQHKFFDQALTDVIVKEKDAQVFCDAIYDYMSTKMPEGKKPRKVGIGQLLSWGLLHEADHDFRASNGYLLLHGRSQHFPDTGIQCAVYKGNRRGTFVAHEEYAGLFFDNLDRTMQFIDEHLQDRDEHGQVLGRSRLAELPRESIREIIVNALCHRSYQAPGKIQVSLFDDKFEVVSPGGLDCSLAVEDIISGRSRVRNPAIASALRYTEMFEGWGNGIPQLLAQAEELGLPRPTFRARPGDFLVRLGTATEMDSDDVPEEPVSDFLVQTLAQVPTVALLEPTSESVGSYMEVDQYEFAPYGAPAHEESASYELREDGPEASQTPLLLDSDDIPETAIAAAERALALTDASSEEAETAEEESEAPAKRSRRSRRGGRRRSQAQQQNAAPAPKAADDAQSTDEDERREDKPDEAQAQSRTRRRRNSRSSAAASAALSQEQALEDRSGLAKRETEVSDQTKQNAKQPGGGRNGRQEAAGKQNGRQGNTGQKARQQTNAGQNANQQSGNTGQSADRRGRSDHSTEQKSSAKQDKAQQARETQEQKQQASAKLNTGKQDSTKSKTGPKKSAKPSGGYERTAAAKAKADQMIAAERELRNVGPVVAVPDSVILPEAQQLVLDTLRDSPKMTQNQLCAATSLSLATVRRAIAALEEKSYLVRYGGRRYGHWIVHRSEEKSSK